MNGNIVASDTNNSYNPRQLEIHDNTGERNFLCGHRTIDIMTKLEATGEHLVCLNT